MAEAARPQPSVRAWRPRVEGVAEVLHAFFPHHAYPSHTHDTWTLLVVDAGVVAYDLDRRHHGTVSRHVTLLPPGVPHDGRAATPGGFRKRVVYLEPALLPADRVGAAVDHPGWADPVLFGWVDGLHGALRPGEELEAESRLALVRERLGSLLGHDLPTAARALSASRPQAHRLRDLIDSRLVDGITLAEAAADLDAHPTQLVRAFVREFGIPPHRYLTGRRLDRARRLLLAGVPASTVAVEVGFHDQAHLTRHFRRLLGVPPGRYAAGA